MRTPEVVLKKKNVASVEGLEDYIKYFILIFFLKKILIDNINRELATIN